MDIQLQRVYYQWKLDNIYNHRQIIAVTICPKGKKKTMEYVLEEYAKLRIPVDDMIVVTETSDKGLNHMHGIALISRKSKYSTSKNLTILPKKLYGIYGWSKYVTKDNPRYAYRITHLQNLSYKFTKWQLKGEHLDIMPYFHYHAPGLRQMYKIAH